MLAVNKKIPIFAIQHGAISSVGRAPDCGSGCRGFEPHIAPQDGRNAVFFVLRRADLVARNPKNTFEQQSHSTAFW